LLPIKCEAHYLTSNAIKTADNADQNNVHANKTRLTPATSGLACHFASAADPQAKIEKTTPSSLSDLTG
jgi:hypothetical protein